MARSAWVRSSAGKTSRSARHSPSAPSPTITTGAPIPRRRRSRSSSAQSSVDSRVPSATATSSLRPSARTPTITRQHSRPCSPRRMLKCTPSAQQYTSSTSERSRCPKASRSACHWVVSRVTTEADRPAAEPNSSVNAGTKSLELSPCRYSSGSTSATFPAAPDPPGQDHALELLALAGLGVDAAVVDPRADHLDLPCAGGDLPGWGVAVAAHQPVPVLVDQLGEGGQVNVDLGLQRSCQHPAGALAGQLVQAHRQLTPGSIVCNSTQHVAAFGPRRRLPRRRPSNTVRVEGTPRSHARGSSTDFDDISTVEATSCSAHRCALGSDSQHVEDRDGQERQDQHRQDDQDCSRHLTPSPECSNVASFHYRPGTAQGRTAPTWTDQRPDGGSSVPFQDATRIPPACARVEAARGFQGQLPGPRRAPSPWP